MECTWRSLFCISRSSVVPSSRVGYFLEFSVKFCLFAGQISIWSQFISLLSMNTSSYSPITSGTYNRWKVKFVLKTKMTKTSIQRRLWQNFIQRSLVVPIFIHSRSLLFEGNGSLKCVYSGLTPLSTVFQSYRDNVWLLQRAQFGLVDPIFIHIIRDFPVLLLADFRILTICIINLYIFAGDVFGFNLGIDSTKYFLLSGYVIQLLKINLWRWIDAVTSMFH